MKRIAVFAVASVGLIIGSVVAGPLHTGDLAVMTAASAMGASGSPMVEITKECPGLRYVGRNATFEITVSNKGSGAAQNVVVTDVIPPGIDFVSADNGGVRQGGNIVWRIGTLPAGKSAVLKSTFRCNKIGKFRNTAAVTYCAELSAACELEVKGIPAILLECVDEPDPIEINGTLTYTIRVTNQGTAVGTNIVIACVLPKEEAHVSSTGPTTATVAGQKITFAPLAKLAPKATTNYKITVKGVGEGDVRFHVKMTSDQLTSPVEETESTHIY